LVAIGISRLEKESGDFVRNGVVVTTGSRGGKRLRLEQEHGTKETVRRRGTEVENAMERIATAECGRGKRSR
jgi:hypothetical protein